MEETLLIDTPLLKLSQQEFLIRMLIALGIGFVLGLEREHTKEEGEKIFAGVRTFILVTLFGFFLAFLSAALYNHWLFTLSFVACIVFVGLSYYITAIRGDLGGTSEFAVLIAFLLGASVLAGYIQISLALTVVILLVLSMKVRLHNLVSQITNTEWQAFVKFVVIAILILPFLPDKAYDPFGVIKAREIGWVVVLTSAIGFIGYLLVKFLGANRGILLTGLVGGLVSSTAVTWLFAKKSKESPDYSMSCAIAILGASTIMIVRVGVWVYLFNPDLLGGLLLPLALLLCAGLCCAFFYYQKQQKNEKIAAELPKGEPLNLKDALFFGVMYAGILLLVSYANAYFGTKGIYLASSVAALTDIDAITISVAKLGGDTILVAVAQNTILIATLSNTIVKIGIASWFGSKELRKYIVIGYGLMFIGGLIGFIVLNLF